MGRILGRFFVNPLKPFEKLINIKLFLVLRIRILVLLLSVLGKIQQDATRLVRQLLAAGSAHEVEKRQQQFESNRVTRRRLLLDVDIDEAQNTPLERHHLRVGHVRVSVIRIGLVVLVKTMRSKDIGKSIVVLITIVFPCLARLVVTVLLRTLIIFIFTSITHANELYI
ncbi:uncharacterized protein PgNI_09340 [Pyricularia grisea]|uniref:Uncharacterized protein n=1 Tax=Pyricularia grisea TaxID=148305 RepID=A0A6P8AT00_PYRGI|nr:uncharacterized protein PgNI_09340 [Pyricularia grisea]TLD05238.1 hypothetical protein PgNI_09340 [Pyricularia grisea]